MEGEEVYWKYEEGYLSGDSDVGIIWNRICNRRMRI